MSRKIRFYTDEHVSHIVVKGLRNRGADVMTTKEAGMLGASDDDHIALASEQGRVIFTQDDDFLKLHAEGVNHSGIVYARQHTPAGDIIRGLMLVYHVPEPDDMRNHVEFL
jgi:predicted nuclease of predicted toxin-antitoxin system